MKTALSSKSPAFLIIVFIFMQSCTVYHSASVDLDRAVQSQNKVKVVANNNDIYKFKKIIAIDNSYYGISKANRNSNLVNSDNEGMEKYSKNLNSYPLKSENIKGIYTKNRGMSTALNIGVPVVLVATATVIIAQSLVFDFGSGIGY